MKDIIQSDQSKTERSWQWQWTQKWWHQQWQTTSRTSNRYRHCEHWTNLQSNQKILGSSRIRRPTGSGYADTNLIYDMIYDLTYDMNLWCDVSCDEMLWRWRHNISPPQRRGKISNCTKEGIVLIQRCCWGWTWWYTNTQERIGWWEVLPLDDFSGSTLAQWLPKINMTLHTDDSHMQLHLPLNLNSNYTRVCAVTP